MPDQRHVVRLQRPVVAHDNGSLERGLSHQQAIERVAVMPREGADRLGVLDANRQRLGARAEQLPGASR